jgi:hypothetical protein
MMTLFEHAATCTPLMPCQACELVTWLRGKLNEADFEELVNRVENLGPPKKPRGRRRKHGRDNQLTLDEAHRIVTE